MVKLIITDIDGCLSPEDSSAWDAELFASLMNLARKAAARRTTLAPITLCTGRPQPYVEPLAKLLDIRMPIICENGAVVYSLDDNWSRFGPGVTNKKLEGLRAVRRFIEREILPAHPEALYQFGKEAMLSVYSAEPRILPHIQQAIADHIHDRELPPVVMGLTEFYLNISMTGVDKGTTLAWLLDDLGIAKEEAVGIGDTMGDLPIHDEVGWFACPGNAAAALQAEADYVSPYLDLRGLIDILYQPACQQSF